MENQSKGQLEAIIKLEMEFMGRGPIEYKLIHSKRCRVDTA
jgi:hypothetical protein